MLETNKIYCGDCYDLIDELDDNSVQSIITSPPYWALRDYGVDGQLGLEENFNDYINKLISIFNKCKRVLKDDGILFVNLGDTYYGGGNNRGNTKTLSKKQKGNRGANGQVNISFDYKLCKRKSLVGIPQRFMIGMIDSEWICRNQIIWKKNNVMPTSAKDRFTIDYETILMFSKEPIYKFNQLLEDMKTKDTSRPRGSKGTFTKNSGLRGDLQQKEDLKRNTRTVWEINTQPLRETHFTTFPEELAKRMILCSTNENDLVLDIFMGSGTTGKVAYQNNRKFIGFELNKDYVELANLRISKACYQNAMMLAT